MLFFSDPARKKDDDNDCVTFIGCRYFKVNLYIIVRVTFDVYERLLQILDPKDMCQGCVSLNWVPVDTTKRLLQKSASTQSLVIAVILIFATLQTILFLKF